MIIFRADGNPKIGAGHIMRCLSIADAAKDKGETCEFILSSEDFKDVVVRNGHKAIVLNSDYTEMDPEEILGSINDEKPSAVFVDSYFVTERYMDALHQECTGNDSKLAYIDDRCSTVFPCDALVNYNISANAGEYVRLYENANKPAFLLGTEFAPLRKEFRDQGERIVSRKARDILVSTGGADSEHFTLALIGEAKQFADYNFHFVVGMMNPDKAEIRKSASQCENIIIHENVTQMAELMRYCDAAISASGSTLYELCATQTPAVTYVLADNQIPLATGFDARKIIQYYGDIRITGKDKLARDLINAASGLADDYDQRVCISKTMRTVVDGNGAGRIIDRILG